MQFSGILLWGNDFEDIPGFRFSDLHQEHMIVI